MLIAIATVVALVLIYLGRRLQLRFKRPCSCCGSIRVKRIYVIFPVENDANAGADQEGFKFKTYTFGRCVVCKCVEMLKTYNRYLSGLHLWYARCTQLYDSVKHSDLFRLSETPLPSLKKHRVEEKHQGRRRVIAVSPFETEPQKIEVKLLGTKKTTSLVPVGDVLLRCQIRRGTPPQRPLS